MSEAVLDGRERWNIRELGANVSRFEVVPASKQQSCLAGAYGTAVAVSKRESPFHPAPFRSPPSHCGPGRILRRCQHGPIPGLIEASITHLTRKPFAYSHPYDSTASVA